MDNKMKPLTLFLLITIGNTLSYKVFKSIIPLEIFDQESGLDFDNSKSQIRLSTNDLSICVRFYLRRLDFYPFFFWYPETDTSISFLKITGQSSWFKLGNGNLNETSASLILKKKDKNTSKPLYDMWNIGKWETFCFAYKSSTGKLSLFKARQYKNLKSYILTLYITGWGQI